MGKYTEPGGPRWYDSPLRGWILLLLLAFIAWGLWLAGQEFHAIYGG